VGEWVGAWKRKDGMCSFRAWSERATEWEVRGKEGENPYLTFGCRPDETSGEHGGKERRQEQQEQAFEICHLKSPASPASQPTRPPKTQRREHSHGSPSNKNNLAPRANCRLCQLVS